MTAGLCPMRIWADVEPRRNGEDAEHGRRVGSSPAHLGRDDGVRKRPRSRRQPQSRGFPQPERERIGKILQEMVTEAEEVGLYDIEPLPFRR